MRSLISMDDLSKDEIERIIQQALEYKRLKSRTKVLEGKFIVTAFFEPSTRTKLSFQKAAMALGAEVLDFLPSVSSLQKGETDLDTLMTIEAMDVDAIVVRTRKVGAPKLWSEVLSIPVINGGDGTNEHPTQALLDLVTMFEHFGRLDLNVAIVGDILHSRVANSLAKGLKKFGAKVRMCGPKEFLPGEHDAVDFITTDLQEALDGADVVYVLRIQRERIEQAFDGARKFFERFQVNEKVLNFAPSHAVIMHPGPFNRDVEISSGVVYSERSLILEQVRNGVYTRMAILKEVLSEVGEDSGLRPVQKVLV